MAVFLDAKASDFEAKFVALLNAKRESAADVDDAVAAIIADVRARGDAALADYSQRFDRVDLARSGLTISAREVDEAVNACDRQGDRGARIRQRARARLSPSPGAAGCRLHRRARRRTGWRWRPIEAVGLYVPGGAASYPSSVLMNAAPAKVAGCPRVAMVVPTPDGQGQSARARRRARSPASTKSTASAARRRSLRSPMAPQTIKPVAKIVGPGNAYVAAAKRRVFGVVGIDMIAGPSEVVVLADSSANPRYVAADLLAQAEHDEAAQSILITDDVALARNVGEEVMRQLAQAAARRRSPARAGAITARSSWSPNLARRVSAGRPAGARASRNHRARRRRACSRHQQRRRDLPRPPYAGGDRRLCRRLQPCAADLALGALLLRPRRL